MPYLGLKKFFKAINKCQKCVGKSRLYQLAQINQLQQPIRQSTQSFTFIHSELGTLGPWLLRISLMWFSLMPEIFFLSEMKNCQNGTFEHVHEIQKFFWPKAFFWSIMKMAIRNFFRNMSQGLPNPGFMQEKVQKGDFLWCPMMKTNFNPFFRFYTSRVHDFC